MDQFQMDHQALYHLLKIKCERETLDDILQGMRTLLADEAMPTAEQVRAFLQAPDGDTALDPQQQMVAMDQLCGRQKTPPKCRRPSAAPAGE